MSIHAEKTQDNKSQAVSNSLAKQQGDGESAFKVADNRPGSIAQRKLQEAINNSPRVQQMNAYSEMANNSPNVKQLRAYQAMADNYTSQKAVQRNEAPEEEPLQGEFIPLQKENKTGLPDNLKSGIENLSGISLDDVRVHHNSDKPAQLQAHAYAQGTNIHVGPGQERTLPHEAWHVVQQKQGRVKPTLQMKGEVNVNDDKGLENEADVMGEKAMQLRSFESTRSIGKNGNENKPCNPCDGSVIQRMVGLEFETAKVKVTPATYKDVLGSGDGFKVEGDSGNLEIVTDPFPTTGDGKVGLVKAVTKATGFVGSIDTGLTTRLKNPTARNKFAGITWTENSHEATMKSKGGVTCHPQATMGIPLSTMADMYRTISKDAPEFEKPGSGGSGPKKKEALPHFAMDERGKGKWLAMKRHMAGALDAAEKIITQLKGILGVDKEHDTDKLLGLLTQIITSMRTATDDVFMDNIDFNSHNVGKNQFVALPKTKLHFLYKLMSRKERQMFVRWVRAFPHKDITIFGKLSIYDWLTNIYAPGFGGELAGEDPQIEGLGSDRYERTEDSGRDRTLKAMTKNLGSPTNIGTSKEDKNESGGIFEFRHLKDAVPLAEWPEVANEAMTLAIWLETNAKLKAYKPEEEDFGGFDMFNEK